MRNRLLWLCFVFNMLAGIAYADGIDPVMQVRDPSCFEGPCATEVGGETGGDPFLFSSNANGGGSFAFHIGTQVTTLDIQTGGIFPSLTDVNCTSNVFHCEVRFLDGVTDMFLTEFDHCESCGIPPTDFFTVVLNDIPPGAELAPFNPQGSGGWGALRDFRAQANLTTAPNTALISAPEPSSLLLLATGVVTLVGRRKLTSKKA
jgi:hypothetical protein